MATRWESLREDWKNFCSIPLHPSVLVPLVVTIAVLFWRSQVETKGVALFLSVTAAVAAGITSNMATRLWIEGSGKGILSTKGRSAIRSLKLLLGHLSSLQRRAEVFHERRSSPDFSPEVLRNNLEEIIGRLGTLEEETISAIEDWKDIIPEADVTTQIGVISSLQRTVEDLTTETDAKSSLLAQLERDKDQSNRESADLRREIAQKARELASVKSDLARKQDALLRATGVQGPAGLRYLENQGLMIGSIGSSETQALKMWTCAQCHSINPVLPGTVRIGNLAVCMSCGSRAKFPD